MKMIVTLRLKKKSYIFPKYKVLIFCEMEPPKKASYISRKNFPYFGKQPLIFWEINIPGASL